MLKHEFQLKRARPLINAKKKLIKWYSFSNSTNL